MNTETCDKCGKEYKTGEWPLCPHGFGSGTLAGGSYTFIPYWDEHVAPAPGPDFKPTGSLPEYHPDKGYYITNMGDRQRLMRLGHMDYRGKKVGDPGCEV